MLVLRPYNGSGHDDAILANWWSELQGGDWEKCFLLPRASVGWFYSYFHRDVQLFLAEEDASLAMALWLERCVGKSVFLSLWVSPTYRGVPSVVYAGWRFLDAMFQSGVSVVLSITHQQERLDLYQRIGYTITGEIPELHQGKPVWLLSLTANQLKRGLYGRRSLRGQGH